MDKIQKPPDEALKTKIFTFESHFHSQAFVKKFNVLIKADAIPWKYVCLAQRARLSAFE